MSRQVRNETVGSLAVVSGIELNIRSNYAPIAEDGTSIPKQCFYPNIGLLQLEGERRKWLEDDKIVFRDIKIDVYCACCPKRRIGAFFVSINGGGYTVKWRVYYLANLKILGMAFAGVKEDIIQVLTEGGFEGGLKLGDLEHVVKCFGRIKEIVLERK